MKRLFKILLWIIGIFLLIVIGVFSFYVYMIYGIHPSDEGRVGFICNYAKDGQLTSVQKMTITNGKRVITEEQLKECPQE